jgi:hypothetical protein
MSRNATPKSLRNWKVEFPYRAAEPKPPDESLQRKGKAVTDEDFTEPHLAKFMLRASGSCADSIRAVCIGQSSH